jgi:carbamoylphosphate synthase large subunit
MADKIYIEPLIPDTVRRILEIEKPCALLAGMGGQTALNIASELAHDGSLERIGVELIGSDLDAIDKAEDRELFNQVCDSIGLPISEAIACNTMEEVIAAAEEIGSWPILIVLRSHSAVLAVGRLGILASLSKLRRWACVIPELIRCLLKNQFSVGRNLSTK